MNRETYIAEGRKKYGHLLNEPGVRDIFPLIDGHNSLPEELKKALDLEEKERQNLSNIENYL